jgi:integral membrane sensor domain MASE1
VPENSTPPKIHAWFAAHEQIRDVVLNLGVALLSWGLAELVLVPVVSGRSVTPLWPPVGLAVALVYLGGYRLLPGIVLGSFLVNGPREGLAWGGFIALCQVIQPVLVVRILRALKFDPRLERVRDPIILSLVAGPAGALAAAVFVIGISFFAGRIETGEFFYELMLWWLRDWLGTMVTATLVLAWVKGRATTWTWPRIAEAVGLMVAMFLSSQVMFGLWGIFANRNVPIAFVFFPLVGWAGLRFGPRGAATLVALISSFALAVAGLRVGPFATFPLEFIQSLLFCFLALG